MASRREALDEAERIRRGWPGLAATEVLSVSRNAWVVRVLGAPGTDDWIRLEVGRGAGESGAVFPDAPETGR